jgi:hypothetical protein
MTPPISPTGGCPDPAGRGAQLRTVVDTTPVVGRGFRCLEPIAGTRLYCLLPPKHKGRCLSLPKWPREDITPDNPNVRDKS